MVGRNARLFPGRRCFINGVVSCCVRGNVISRNLTRVGGLLTADRAPCCLCMGNVLLCRGGRCSSTITVFGGVVSGGKSLITRTCSGVNSYCFFPTRVVIRRGTGLTVSSPGCGRGRGGVGRLCRGTGPCCRGTGRLGPSGGTL